MRRGVVNGPPLRNLKRNTQHRLLVHYWTVTLAVVSGTFGNELAWITVEPTAIPVIGTITLDVPAKIVTEDGTVATLGWSELRLTVTPPTGAGAERLNVSRSCFPLVMALLDGEKLSVALTSTVWLADGRPPPVAEMVAVPKLTPHTRGVLAPVIAPAGMKTVSELRFPGPNVTFEGSLLVRVMNVPIGPEGDVKLNGNGTHCPGPTVTLGGSRMSSAGTTTSGTPGVDEYVML